MGDLVTRSPMTSAQIATEITNAMARIENCESSGADYALVDLANLVGMVRTAELHAAHCGEFGGGALSPREIRAQDEADRLRHELAIAARFPGVTPVNPWSRPAD